MKPQTDDERQLLLARIIRELGRLRTDAQNTGCDFLTFMLAQSEDEARERLSILQGSASQGDE